MERRHLLLLALTLGLAAGCRSEKKKGSAAAPAEKPPELAMHGLKVQSWGPRGLEWEMRAPVGEGFTQRNVIQVSSMTAQLYENGQPSTQVSAPLAIMATGDRPRPPEVPHPVQPKPGISLVPGDMYLDGGVVVVSTDGIRLTTDWVQYYVDEQVIRSSAPVVVTRPDSVTKGVGLEATTDLSSIKIFNQTLTIKGDEGQK